MLPLRPYLLNSLLEWIADNNQTPHIRVDTTKDGVSIPPGVDNNGKVVLDVSAQAISGLMVSNDSMVFSAKFGGRPFQVQVPMDAIEVVFSKESGMGMVLPPELVPPAPELPPEPKKKGSHLRVVK